MVSTVIACIMFWMRAYPWGQVGGGWALEFESFSGPVKWHRADRRVPFGAQKNSRIPGPIPLPLAQVMDMHASKTLCTGLYKHGCTGGFMHKSPQERFQGPYWGGGWRSRCIKELVRPARDAPPITKLILTELSGIIYFVVVIINFFPRISFILNVVIV